MYVLCDKQNDYSGYHFPSLNLRRLSLRFPLTCRLCPQTRKLFDIIHGSSFNYNFLGYLLHVKVQSVDNAIPPATVVELPPVHVNGELVTKPPRAVRSKDGPSETEESFRSRSKSKTHLYVSAEIGAFQHSLTTDLLNHLVFVQKSFMKVCSVDK